MILATGIDAIEISRFDNWKSYPKKQLLKIFDQSEIDYCLKNINKSNERFAARFATKEAFFKSISSLLKIKVSFCFLCKNLKVTKDITGAPSLIVNWKNLDFKKTGFKNLDLKNLKINLSITHTKSLALAVIILSQ